MNSPVFKQARDLSEKFHAFIAFVRPFTGVYGLMFEKVTALAEEFPTLAAHMRSLSSVDSLVSSKCVFLGECFPIFTAFFNLLSSTKGSPTPSAHVGASFCHETPSAEGQRWLACAFCLHRIHRSAPSHRFCSFSESLVSSFLKNFSPLCCGEFLSTVFLVLMEVCTEPELSPIGLTLVWLLPGRPLLVIQ